MKAKQTAEKIKIFNVLPSSYKGLKYYMAGFNLLSDSELETEGFYDVEIPEHNSVVEELTDLKFDESKKKFVYSVKDKTWSESVSDLKEQAIVKLDIKKDIDLGATQKEVLDAFEAGTEISQKTKDERSAIKKKYDDDIIALNSLTKKSDIVKFI
jgi:hypothetical protein|tara:strand:+ start:896 stop:1360 length:465 start_codon:yes stop_codon:yes gene_type:complete